MKHYLLDTNIVSHIIKGDLPQVRARLEAIPIHSLCISVVTQGELLYGVAKRGHPVGLDNRVREFLTRVDILPWTPDVAEVYGRLRAGCEAGGAPLGALDMMIAAQAHAMHLEAERAGNSGVLVTRDKAFARLPPCIPIEDWTQPC
uniref:type II toxin-antitoxin system VapC family toxin n=1 Tax=Castellaniella defragrans TaxID=75697 RepID=UPI0033427B94